MELRGRGRPHVIAAEVQVITLFVYISEVVTTDIWRRILVCDGVLAEILVPLPTPMIGSSPGLCSLEVSPSRSGYHHVSTTTTASSP